MILNKNKKAAARKKNYFLFLSFFPSNVGKNFVQQSLFESIQIHEHNGGVLPSEIVNKKISNFLSFSLSEQFAE